MRQSLVRNTLFKDRNGILTCSVHRISKGADIHLLTFRGNNYIIIFMRFLVLGTYPLILYLKSRK